jgi:hypothetical protein
VVAPRAGEDLALEVEQVVRPGDEREELARRTRMGVEGGLLRRRRLAWAGVLAILGAFLAVPLVSGRFEGAWNSGSISRKHSFIANDCAACHAGFERVRNDGCLVCHGDIPNHASIEASPTALNQARCAGCHIEHNGASGLAQIDGPLCESCHANLGDVYGATEIGDASDFRKDHPEFRLFLVSDPGSGAREPALWSPELRERSGVRFSHWRHVGQVVPYPDGRKENLRCDACHRLDAGGKYMTPISFEAQCQVCHTLAFDEDFPDTEAVHGDPVAMREQLRGLYSEQALKGEVKDEEAPGPIRFLRPGQELTEEEAQIVFAWVEKKVAEAEDHLMVKPGECARCHELLPGQAEDGGTDVAPVEIASVWMPKSRFRHVTHGPFPCRDCHPAAAAWDPADEEATGRPEWSLPGAGPYALFTPEELRDARDLAPSESSEDVILPGIDDCRGCHGGAGSSPPLVASPCVLCHPFHREEHGTMRERLADEGAARERLAHTQPVHFRLPMQRIAGVDSPG